MSYFSMKSITLIPLLTHSRPFEKRIFPFSIASRTIFSQEESFWISLETKIDITSIFDPGSRMCWTCVRQKQAHTVVHWQDPWRTFNSNRVREITLTKLRLNSTILSSRSTFLYAAHTRIHTRRHTIIIHIRGDVRRRKRSFLFLFN